MRFLILFMLIGIVAVSGCTFNEIFGVSQPTKKEGTNDVVIIKDTNLVPAPPLLPGQPFTLMITVENKDEKRNAELVDVFLFDPSIFKVRGNRYKQIGTLLPRAENVIYFSLVAPSASEIGNVILSPVISYWVRYWFRSITNFDVVIVSQKELARRQQRGEGITVPAETVISSGPVELRAELLNAKYLITDVLASPEEKNMFDAQMALKVIERGSGELDGSWIEACMIYLKFPKEAKALTENPEYWWCGSVSPYEISGIISSGKPIQTSKQLKAICEKIVAKGVGTTTTTSVSTSVLVDPCAQYGSVSCDVNDPNTDCCNFGVPGLSCRCKPNDKGTCPQKESINDLPFATCVSSDLSKVWYTSKNGTVVEVDNNTYCDYKWDKSINCTEGTKCCQLPFKVDDLEPGKPGCYPIACCEAKDQDEANTACKGVTKEKWEKAIEQGNWSSYDESSSKTSPEPAFITPEDLEGLELPEPSKPTQTQSPITGMAVPENCEPEVAKWVFNNADASGTIQEPDPAKLNFAVKIKIPESCDEEEFDKDGKGVDVYIDIEEYDLGGNDDLFYIGPMKLETIKGKSYTIYLPNLDEILNNETNESEKYGCDYESEDNNKGRFPCFIDKDADSWYDDSLSSRNGLELIFAVKFFKGGGEFKTEKDGLGRTEFKQINVKIPNNRKDCDSDSDCVREGHDYEYEGDTYRVAFSHCSGPAGPTGISSDEGDFCCPQCFNYDYDLKKCVPCIPEAKGPIQKLWDKVSSIVTWIIDNIDLDIAYAGKDGKFIDISTKNGKFEATVIKANCANQTKPETCNKVYEFNIGDGIDYEGKHVYIDTEKGKIYLGKIDKKEGGFVIKKNGTDGTIEVGKMYKSKNCNKQNPDECDWAIAISAGFDISDKIAGVILNPLIKSEDKDPYGCKEKVSSFSECEDFLKSLIIKKNGNTRAAGKKPSGSGGGQQTSGTTTTSVGGQKVCGPPYKVRALECSAYQQCKEVAGQFINVPEGTHCCEGECSVTQFTAVDIETRFSFEERVFDDDDFKDWCINWRPIQIFRGESAKHVFRIRPMITTDVFRTARIKIVADYAYVIRDSKEIKIEPFGR